MTEIELEIVRLKMQIESVKLLIRTLYTAMANSLPTGPQLLRDQFSKLREEHQKIVIPGVPPEMSDLVAGEWQEALDDILSFIESGLRK